MKLVEQGRVDLKAPVRTYLPDFAVQDPAATKDVAVWHLLTHTPGWEGQLSTEDRGVDALAHFVTTIMRDLPQLAPPGAVWSYNNAGFALAGRLIEVVTGRNIHDALRELVFAPLGLTRTFTRLPDVMTYRYTLGHREQNGRTAVIRPYQTTSSTTAGGVMTSLADLHALRAVPSGRRHRRRGQAVSHAGVAGRHARAAPEEEQHARRDGHRLAPPPGRRRDDGGARRHAERPLPSTSSSSRRAISPS